MTGFEHDTDTFHIEINNPVENRDGSVSANVIAKPHSSEERGYDEKIKFTGRSASEYANNVKGVFEDLGNDDKEELKNELLALKNDARDMAAVNPENQDGREETNQSESLQEKKWNEILQRLISEGGEIKTDKIQNQYPNFRDLADKYGNDALILGDVLQITDEGRERVKEFLGFDQFEGDPQAEAQRQLENGTALQYYLESFNKIHKGDHLLKIWELISAMSSTCADRQIHSWAVGPSGKGKSHLKRELLKFLPPESYEQKESFSPKALQYKATDNGSDFLDNQLVYFDEVGENIENAIELIRLLTDQDKDVITHETVKDQEIITLTLETGNITVWFTSVDTIQDEQLKNRFILTNPDASSAQDETVNEHQQNILNYGGELDFIPKEAPVIQRIIRDIREETPELKPVVPFKVNWKQEFNRRLYPFFYTLMGMIAKIHYKQRETRDGYIFVTRSDFELARLIWGRLIDTTVAQTDEQSIKLLKELPESEENALTRQELRLRLNGFSTNKVKETTEKLEETEELQLINSKYEEGEYRHWAGADVKKLVDNEPEIEDFNEETVKEMINEAGVEPDEQLLENIFESEIEVINFLKEKIAEEKQRETEEDDTPDVEIEPDEETFLEQCRQFGWSATINTLGQMNSDKDFDFIEVATQLEEKGVIKLDGENVPSPTTKLDRLKSSGEVIL